MLFNSVEFLIFFPLVTALYFLLPHAGRWGLLLGASCVFYMAFIPQYLLILGLTIVIDYVAALFIEDSRSPARKKKWLVASIFSTCLVLFVFKYFNFFNANFRALAEALHFHYPVEMLNIILPIGLSFHTFQSLSYVIEVYRGAQKAERHFGIYALYVMFYPQLVAGPIERPQNLLHQFHERHAFEYRRVADGLKLMAWGLFKKVVIADRLALLVNQVYGTPYEYTGWALILATVFFSFQIYCDFSGYSDIAIGAAQTMGFKLMDNFHRPYFSKSIAEFWKRWHISLSTWFRDYLYIPLGGNRISTGRTYVNLLITFLVSGLWHGANWTYVFWGLLNGFYLVFSLWTQAGRERLARLVGWDRLTTVRRVAQVACTFGLVTFAWIFFRARNMNEAVYIVQHLLVDLTPASLLPVSRLGLSPYELAVGVAAVGFLELVHLLQRSAGLRHLLSEKPWPVRWAVYYALVCAIVVFGVFERSQFIYFQF